MSDTLTITINKNNKSFKIYGTHSFLKNNKEVIFESNHWGFSLRVLGLDDDCTPLTVSQNGEIGYHISAHSEHLKVGVYQIDESDEDHISVTIKE